MLKLKQEHLTSSVEVPRGYYAILERRRKRSNSRPRNRTKTKTKTMGDCDKRPSGGSNTKPRTQKNQVRKRRRKTTRTVKSEKRENGRIEGK